METIKRNEIIRLHYQEDMGIRRIRSTYARLYPNERVPSLGCIRNTIEKFERYGSFEDRRKYNGREINQEQHYTVLQAVGEFPRISCRQLERLYGVSRASAHHVLRRLNSSSSKLHYVIGTKCTYSTL